MVLQYPKLSETAGIVHYSDYLKMHQDYMQHYKKLYEDVAGFSLLPEKFINEAEPVIDKYLRIYSNSRTEEGRLRLIEITDFMSVFHEFMDETTDMFLEHQTLSEQTFNYLQQLSAIGKKQEGKRLIDFEADYVQLIPGLEQLTKSLYRVRNTVDTITADLERLKPLWAGISMKTKTRAHTTRRKKAA
jgi:hypothetical protein